MVQKFLETMSQKLELPSEVVAGLPKLELAGFSQLSIEEHKGVLRYEREKISVAVTMGVIHLEGTNLSILLMNQHNLRIGGNLTAIVLEGKDG